MIKFVTGHRPDKLGGYSLENNQKLTRFAISILKKENLDDLSIVTGMALGWDQAVANACDCLKIPFIAAIPCPDQDKLWDLEDKIRYKFLLLSTWCIRKIIVSPEYTKTCMQIRNIWMVDNSEEGISLWDGIKKGGTYNCLKYANKKKKVIKNYWNEWGKFEK